MTISIPEFRLALFVLAGTALVIALLWRRRSLQWQPLRLSLGDVDGREYHLRVAVDEPFEQPIAVAERPTTSDGEESSTAQRPLTRIVIDSVLLAHAYWYVSRRHLPDRNSVFVESFVWGGGVMLDDNLFVVTQILPVKLSHQAVAGATADPSSSIVALEALDSLELVACMHFHNHPTAGRNGNLPSGTDRRFQAGLEGGGSIAVGCIFSKDGYARFFAGDLDRFVVEVVGNNARKVGDNEFQLDFQNIPHERLVFRP